MGFLEWGSGVSFYRFRERRKETAEPHGARDY